TGGITALSGVVAVADQPGGTGEEAAAAGEAHVVTVATDLKEPSDAIVGPPVDGIGQLIVVESGMHRITWVPVAKAAERIIDEGAQRSERPVTEVGPGPLTIRVLFTPPAGHELDDSLGPSTQVTVSTTPSSMLTSGAGADTALERTLELDPAYTEGVLHASARAASCDADPTSEFPVCTMHQQYWGVPVRVVEGAPTHLVLSRLDCAGDRGGHAARLSSAAGAPLRCVLPLGLPSPLVGSSHVDLITKFPLCDHIAWTL